jgi:hypothetical protein
LTSESRTSVEEIGILCKNNVLQAVRNIIWYKTNYDFPLSIRDGLLYLGMRP